MAISRSIRGAALLLLLAAALLLSPVLSAADFEGFDSDDLDDSDSDSDAAADLSFTSPIPPPTTLTQSAIPDSPASPIPADPAPKPPSSLDFWDEDEFEGLPESASVTPDPVSTPTAPPSTDPPPPPPPFTFRTYTIEIICLTFLIMFLGNYFSGKRQNEVLALSWAAKFAIKDSIFDKNFSLLGTGDGKDDTPLLLKEGNDVFKFYASGRRYCSYMLATMELRSRHDLIARLTDVLFAKRDTITFEVAMNEDAMDHVVLALARQKTAKGMLKEERDLQRYAAMAAGPGAGRRWVAEELAVVTESREVAGDLINDVVLDQVFGEKAFESFGKLFISLHFSDQYPGSHKKILMFKFALPDANNMADMTRLVTLVPYYIDLIGRYKLSSQARSKTEVSRTKAAQEAFKELQILRQEELQKRRADKKKSPEVTETKLSAEALRRREEKERAKQLKKSMPKIKMMR